MEKLDYKKKYKDLYMPKRKPSIVQVPKMIFIWVEGKGDPNRTKKERLKTVIRGPVRR